MLLGITTPVIHLNPRFTPPEWESTATVEDVVTIAQEAERLGYDWVSASEHVAIPLTGDDRRGPTYWDPVATLAYVAAVTTRIRLLSHVVVLGYHHPLEVVKRWGTVDVISHGRVVLGVGVGSLAGEFALLGRDFDDRGPRADDALRAIRMAWGNRTPSYAGSHYSYRDIAVDPCGLDRPLDVWVGGRTKRSLVRALTLGDGWIPFRLDADELRGMFADPQIAALVDAHDGPFERIFAPEPPVDPLDEPGRTRDQLTTLLDLGATGFSVRVVHRSKTHYLEQLAALMEMKRTDFAS